MLTDKEQKIKAMYEKQLAIPRTKYIIVYGILLWGITMLVMLTLVDLFIFKRPFDRDIAYSCGRHAIRWNIIWCDHEKHISEETGEIESERRIGG